MPSFVSTKADMLVNGVMPIDQLRDFVPPVSLISLSLFSTELFVTRKFKVRANSKWKTSVRSTEYAGQETWGYGPG